jgi:hypothetical protein
MSDEVWKSIQEKVYGHYIAAQCLPTACSVCGEMLTPTDFGVDPDTHERMWVTHCCGKFEKYLEKLSSNDLP